MKKKHNVSAEGRRRISEAKKGTHPRSEFKKGNTLWVGRHHSDATKAKLSLAFKDKKLSADVRRRISEGHMGLVPWNKGLTAETSPIMALIGQKGRMKWTPERRRKSGEQGSRYWTAWWKAHPEAKETMTQVNRPTKIELMARESLVKRGIPFTVAKRVEDLCYPDLFLPEQKIAIFCHGCFWHACAQHNPVVPGWLRRKIKDSFVETELEKRGWKVLVAWEHEFKTNKDVVGLKLDAVLQLTPEVSE